MNNELEMSDDEFESLADGSWKYEIESLRRQLAEALAAIKVKDDAIIFCRDKIAYMLNNGEWYNPELALDTAREALAATEPKEEGK